MRDMPLCSSPPALSAADKLPVAEGGLVASESASELAQEVAGDNNCRKRKERETSTEPEAREKMPRTDTSKDEDDGDSSADCKVEDDSGAAANPDERTGGEGENTNIEADLVGTSTASESGSPPSRATSEPPIVTPVTSPVPSIPRRRQSSPYEAEQCAEDKELNRYILRPDQMTTTFKDVHTSPDTINSLRLLTLSLRDPEAFRRGILSRQAPFGVLLYGPPGTGKTMLARALAKEAGIKMMAITYADIQSECVGVAEKNIHKIFRYARRHYPCIIFIDEAESCFRSRSADRIAYHRVDFLNQFLTEMDGIGTQEFNKPIVVAATNRPFDIDEAILRRLGRRIMVDVPDVRGREAILKLHLAGEKLHSDLDLAEIARHTHDFTGSDISDLSIQAAIEAVQEINRENDEQAREHVPSRRRSGADRVIRRIHFLHAKESISPAPKADLVAKIAEFHTRHGSVGGGKRNGTGLKQNQYKDKK